MKNLSAFLNKSWKIDLVLFLCSFGIYFFYFHVVFLNINSLLSSITLDSLKNYYTYVYHVKNDVSLLHFSGMNYPFGEHIVYTDCQPILTFILRLFPFTHNYLIGIMHSLLFLSFIITPVILNKIFRRFGHDKFFSFFAALAIGLLSPQFLKINGGHFALAYGCLIPLSILLILKCIQEKTLKNLVYLFSYNVVLFLLHPYMGFCLSILSFLSLFFLELFQFNRKIFLKNTAVIALVGVSPLFLFKLFMLLSDQHLNRTIEPFGAEMMVENLDSILSPVFGPFKNFMEIFFPNRSFHFEGHTYLSFFIILLSFLFILSLPFTFKKVKIRKEMLVIFIASLLFLFMAFGIHLKVLDFFHIHSASLNQFRAACRFAWIFYFSLPLILLLMVYDLFKTYLKPSSLNPALVILSLSFFSFNLLEAHYFFTLDNSAYWKYDNFFKEDLLSSEEKNNLAILKNKGIQAIIPLPIFHGGSEMYDRPTSDNSMLFSMMYSYHLNTPILSTLLSRTSISETEAIIQLLNSYKKNHVAEKLLGTKDFFVITTSGELMPDENRLLKQVKQFGENDSLKFGYLSMKDLFLPKFEGNDPIYVDKTISYFPDSNSFVCVPFENRKPFLEANIKDYEAAFVLDSNKLKSGDYIVSLHFNYTKKIYRSLAADLIITRNDGTNTDWHYMIPIRYLSGFYDGYGVFEYKITLETKNKYEFIIKGNEDQTYSISNFMLRPLGRDVIMTDKGEDTLVNNFSYH
jgi:hypothetical protein